MSFLDGVYRIASQALDAPGSRAKAVARTLADDLLLMVTGTRVLHVFSNAFHLTMVHLHDLGGRIAPNRSKIFANLTGHRIPLASYLWLAIGTNIEVVHHMRDLGAALSTTYVCNLLV